MDHSPFFNDFTELPVSNFPEPEINLDHLRSCDASEYSPSVLSDTEAQTCSTVETPQLALIRTRKHSNLLEPQDDESFDFSSLPTEVIEDFKSFVVFCKRDWSKISKKLFKVHGLRISSENLRAFHKGLEQDQKPRTRFSSEDDDIILRCVEEIGKNWIQISHNHFADACPLSIRNRYYHLLNKRAKEERQEKKKMSKAKYKNKVASMARTQPKQELNMNVMVSDLKLEDEPEWLNYINSLIKSE